MNPPSTEFEYKRLSLSKTTYVAKSEVMKAQLKGNDFKLS